MRELKKYCLMSRKKFYVLSIILGVVLEIVGTALMMMPDEDDEIVFDDPRTASIITFILIVIFWLIIHYYYITKPRKRFMKRLDYFQKNGLLNYALSDINRGVTKFDGKLLLGEYCIMGKGTGLVVFYNEIAAIYVKIDRDVDDDSGPIETWTLKFDAGGKTYELCTLARNDQTVRDWTDICNFLRLKAPNIQIK